MSCFELPFNITPDDIAQQRAEVLQTTEYHDINETNAVIIGGAGLALQGLYTGVPMLADKMPGRGRQPFDVDAVVIPGSPLWRKGLFGKDNLHYDAAAEAPLPVTLIRGNTARTFAFSKFRYPDLETMVADREEIDGLCVLPLKTLVEGKLGVNSDRVKDRVGILGAHMIAMAYGNPIAEDPHWQSAVTRVVEKLSPNRQDAPIIGVDPMLPAWVNNLRSSNFDHPAFDSIRDIPAQVS